MRNATSSPPRWLLLLAVLGAAGGAIGDILLLYVPEPAFLGDSLLYLTKVPSLLWGMLLGVLLIPLEGFGLWWLFLKLREFKPKTAHWALALGIGFVAIGVAVHAAFGFIGMGYESHAVRDWSSSALLRYDLMTMFALGIIGGVAFLLHIVLNVMLFIAQLRGPHPFPSWFKWVNPLLLYVLFVLPYYIVPQLGYLTAPAAFNLAYGVFFLVLLLLKFNRHDNFR